MEMQQAYEKEMKFLEKTIAQNPKSYWVWLHREWIIGHFPECDWKREIQLCSKLLKLDERNCKRIE
jgi:geranylgeranyl transferase type-2 subunit alpha